ncbi:MAG: hypothetical protein ACYDA8_14970 [Deferrisomatales bacterium]
MKGIGWIVMLASLLGVTYLVARDLGAMRGDRGGQAVLEPLAKAQEAAGAANRARDAVRQGLEKIDR